MYVYYLNVWLVYIKTSTDAVKNLQTYVKSSLDLYVANVISLTHTHPLKRLINNYTSNL